MTVRTFRVNLNRKWASLYFDVIGVFGCDATVKGVCPVTERFDNDRHIVIVVQGAGSRAEGMPLQS